MPAYSPGDAVVGPQQRALDHVLRHLQRVLKPVYPIRSRTERQVE